MSLVQSVLRALLGGGQAGRLGSIAAVVALRTLLQDRIASLNGRSVEHVLKQDQAAFTRLIGVSVLQSAASSVLAPSLKHVADALALAWRRRLTAQAHEMYLKRNNFYTVSQVRLGWHGVSLAEPSLARPESPLEAQGSARDAMSAVWLVDGSPGVHPSTNFQLGSRVYHVK